jgi:hypothetical protein
LAASTTTATIHRKRYGWLLVGEVLLAGSMKSF